MKTFSEVYLSNILNDLLKRNNLVEQDVKRTKFTSFILEQTYESYSDKF